MRTVINHLFIILWHNKPPFSMSLSGYDALAQDRQAVYFPVSFAQQRLWLIDQLDPGKATYNISSGLRILGTLDAQVLEQTLDEMVRRHESLRTRFMAVGGNPQQIIEDTADVDFLVLDLSSTGGPEEIEAEAKRLAQKEARRPFDLKKAPLLRTRLLRLNPQHHLLVYTMHHIISDGWSLGVLAQEVSALYEAFRAGRPSPLAELPIQYADYSLWQRERLETGGFEKQLAYWKRQLADTSVLELPTDRPRPATPSQNGATIQFVIGADIAAKFKKLSERQGATLFMGLLAAFDTLLYRYSGQQDIIVGLPIAGRTPPESEGLIGFFVNTLVLRADLSGSPSFTALLQKVKETTLEAFDHQEVPFQKVIESLSPERNLSHTPLFQVMITMQNLPDASLRLGDTTVEPFSIESGTAKFDLTMDFAESNSGTLLSSLEYDADLFEESSARRMISHYEMLLSGIVANPEKPVDALVLLTHAERKQILIEWNQTTVEYLHTTLYQMLEEQACKTPQAIALVYEGQKLSYAELHERANQLGHYLQDLGVGPEARVGICVERSLEMVIGLLGILKAGGVYVPLDPEYPPERLAYMLKDAALNLLLTQQHFQHAGESTSIRRLELDAKEVPWAGAPTTPVMNNVMPDHAVYMIYTSGSTGRPKGAINTHAGIANRLLWMQDAYHLEAADKVLQKTPFSFDVSVWEFFWPLTTGAGLVMARPGGHRDSAYLAELIEREAITTLHFVPSMLSLFLEEPGIERCRSLKRVISSGETLPKATIDRFFARLPGVELHNLYGPTEAAVDVTFWPCAPRDPSSVVPIGRAIANTQLYVLDAIQQPAPIGIAGELHLGGVGLARGYLNRPELTAERFVPHPFSAEGGARLYRTGDRARWRSDGNLEFLGRLDEQIKLRGYRIELGEIEAALREQPGIEQAAVVLREDVPGKKQLAGYVVGHRTLEDGSKTELDLGRIKNRLKQHLPDYMVPTVLMALSALPLSPNGKLDRKRLPALDQSAEHKTAYVEPRTPVEEILCGIWEGVLGVKKVGIQDNFFELGGQSLLATQVMAHIRRAFRVDIPLRRLFEAPTVEEIAKALEDPLQIVGKQSLPPIVPVPRKGPAITSYGQERLWFIYQTDPENPAYNVPFACRIEGPLDVAMLQKSLQEVVHRHESLRTRFVVEQGGLAQVASKNAEVELPVVDLSSTPEKQQEAKARELLAVEVRKPFDLAQGPLLRTMLVRLGEQHHVFLVTMHHIVTDAWSIGIFAQEVFVLYEAFSAGRPSPLPELPIQYIDFSAWQRSWLQGDVLEEQLNHWKKQLTGLGRLSLPFDHHPPDVPSFRGEGLVVHWPKELADALRQIGRQHGSTLYMTVLAAFQLLLYRYTSQLDIPVGSVSAGRTYAETEPLIGFFVNTLVMRTRISETSSFTELLRSVRKTTLEAYAHQDVPFQMLVQELIGQRNLSQTQLFQVTLNLQNQPQPVLQGGTKLEALDINAGTIRFDLSLTLGESGDSITGFLNYSMDLFDETTIREMLRRFEILLRAIVRDSQKRVSEFPLLDDAERRALATGLLATKDSETGRFSPDPVAGRNRLFLVDGEFELAPDDVIGEICVAEEPLTADGHNRSTQPTGSFVPNPFAIAPGARMYRTGELARRRASGILEYCTDPSEQTLESKADDTAMAGKQSGAAPQAAYEGPRNSLEEHLVRIWEESLDVKPIGIHDSFFNLGGHSMLAALVAAQISDELHVDIPVRQFFAAPTIAELAKIVAQESQPKAVNEGSVEILVKIQPAGTESPFFCVHPVAGDVLCYVDLAREIGTEQPFYGFQAPPPDSAFAPLDSIEEIAALYNQEMRRIQPQGPYFLGGWSMGGIVAFEMARQLRKSGETLALLALMDTPLHGSYPGDNSEGPSIIVFFAMNMAYQVGKDPYAMAPNFLQLREEEQLKMIREMLQETGVLPQDAIQSEKRLRDQLAVYTRNMRAFGNYSVEQAEQRMVLLQAAEGGEPGRLAQEWGAWVSDLESYMIPGNHFSMFRRPHVAVLGQHLQRCIREARERIVKTSAVAVNP